MTATVECRRCHKPLYGALSTAVGIGARCAQIEAGELLQLPLAAGVQATPAQLAVGLVAAFMHRADDQVTELLNEGDMRQVAGLFAQASALHLEDLPDGPTRLCRLGLAFAEE